MHLFPIILLLSLPQVRMFRFLLTESTAYGSDELKQYYFSFCFLFFFSLDACLCIISGFFCSRRWLIVILCMVAGFLLYFTWVPLCKDIRRKRESVVLHVDCSVVMFLFVLDTETEWEMLNPE